MQTRQTFPYQLQDLWTSACQTHALAGLSLAQCVLKISDGQIACQQQWRENFTSNIFLSSAQGWEMKHECADTWRRGNLGKGTDCSRKVGFFSFAVWAQRTQYLISVLPVLFDGLVCVDNSLLLQEAFGAVTYGFPLLLGSPLTMAILISLLEIDWVSSWKEIRFYQKSLSFTQMLLYPCSPPRHSRCFCAPWPDLVAFSSSSDVKPNPTLLHPCRISRALRAGLYPVSKTS